ncbi:cell wall-active antibiotics response protein LiaF [Bacillus pinisoli]|uniref:cell wall-active antibiotics response protein LiaF n=1 Tax=Bacillus pinisoli TaxID=2901866 RepID=UPI001FF4CC45|nr:cell wall-active antibiotics response protein LiaF [Bacillus pinisoli]
MFNRLSTDTLNKLLIIGTALLIFELLFMNEGLIFTVAFSSLVVYLGWKKYNKLFGKVFFWFGLVLLIITILNMTTFRFLLVAAIIFFLINYFQYQKSPSKIKPYKSRNIDTSDQESLIKVEPLLQQRLFGDEKTSELTYEWNDINIHGGFGNRVIDLSNTVLPDEAIISIRHFVGNITVYVPYEVEVSLLHSSLLGRVNIFGNTGERLINQTLSYKTQDYLINKPRVKIITSILSGDIEVKRI